jgi:hypothetical protein
MPHIMVTRGMGLNMESKNRGVALPASSEPKHGIHFW